MRALSRLSIHSVSLCRVRALQTSSLRLCEMKHVQTFTPIPEANWQIPIGGKKIPFWTLPQQNLRNESAEVALDKLTMTSRGTPASKEQKENGLSGCIRVFGVYGRLDDVKFMMSNAGSKGIQINDTHIGRWMGALVLHEKFEEVLELFENVEKQWGVKQAESALFSYALLANARLGRTSIALKLFNRMDELALPKNETHYYNIIRCLVTSGNTQEALEIFRKMEKNVNKRSPEEAITDRVVAKTQHMLVLTLGEKGQYEHALDLFIEEEARDTAHGTFSMHLRSARTSLLNVLKKLRRWNLVSKFRSHWDAADRAFNPSIGISRAIRVMQDARHEAARTGNYNKAILAADNVVAFEKLDPFTLSTCFQIYGFAKMPDRVVGLVEKMDREEIMLNLIHCNAAMTAFVRSGKAELALIMFELMEQRWGVKKDKITYGAAMTAYQRLGRWEDALALYKGLSKVGIDKADPILTTAVIKALGAAGQWRQALTLYNDIEEPNNLVRRSILNALRDGHQNELVTRLETDFKIQELKEGYIAPALVNNQFDFRECRRQALRSGNWDAAVTDVLAFMARGNLSDGVVNECFDVFGCAKSSEKVHALLEHLDQRASPMQLTHVNKAIATFNVCGKDNAVFALEIFDKMEEQWPHLKRDSFTYAAGMTAHFLTGDHVQCMKLFNSLESLGIQKDRVIYTIAIQSLGKAGRSTDALALFREMGDMASDLTKAKILEILHEFGPKDLYDKVEDEIMFQSDIRSAKSSFSFDHLLRT